ncbi:MAG TPA: SDR family oxidoreductase [Solirubrobacteraceae bacterium]|nr:SDR family oxidoreductase [Solirubrobacteraceae bacterium]
MPTALITGASTGIGRATALRLAASGWTVLAGVRDAAAGERLAAEAAEGVAGGGFAGARGAVVPLALDVTDAAQISAAAELVRERTAAGGGHGSPVGRLDALVNNAGIGVGGPLELVSPEEWRMQFEVNVFGQVAVTRALLGALRAARGRIVLVSSVGGRVSVPFNGPYAASKHAIEAIGDALRGELYSSRISVSLVEPGGVKTPIWDKARATAERLEVPPELHDEYGSARAAFAKVLDDTERRGVPPERVAATIERALTARRPRARYLIGSDARGMVLARALLPSGAFDRLIRRVLGI